MNNKEKHVEEVPYPRYIAEHLKKSSCLQAGPSQYPCVQSYYSRMNYGEAAEPNQSSSVSDGNTLTLTDRFTAESEEERTVAANRHLANNSITLLFQAIASTKGINIPQELLDQMPGDGIDNSMDMSMMTRIIDLFVENGNMAKQKGDLARKFLALKAKGRENKLPFWEFKHAVCHFASIPF